MKRISKQEGNALIDYNNNLSDSSKADKVSGATADNFAGLDSNGNLKDSGKKASDFLTEDDITDKADKSQLLYKNDTILATDQTPYLQRQALSVEGASPYVKEKLVGASAVVNQLVQNGDFSNGTTGWDAYSNKVIISVSNGIAKVIYQSTASSGLYEFGMMQSTTLVGLKDHKYLFMFDGLLNYDGQFGVDSFGNYKGSDFTANTWKHVEFIFNQSSTQAHSILLRPQSKVTQNNYFQVKNVMCIDLTALFGSSTIPDYLYSLEQTTAGAGVAKLKEWGFLTKDYYPYNAGSLQSVKCSGKKVVGKNLFEVTASTTTISDVLLSILDDSSIDINGTATSNGSYDLGTIDLTNVRGESIKISGLTNGASGTLILEYIFFDKNGSALAYKDVTNQTIDYTLPDNVGVCTARLYIYSGKTYDHIKCKPMIRLSSIEDATYEPYSELTYPTSPIDLRGLYKLDANNNLYADGDVYNADGSVSRKYGIVDLGSLTYQYNSQSAYFYTSDVTLRKYGSGVICISSLYTDLGDKSASDMATVANMSMASNDNSILIKFKNTSYTDPSAFKTAMSGVYLIYELATPTTESTTPFTSPQSLDNVTLEEYLDSRDYPLPVGHITNYMGASDELVEMPSTPLDGEYVLANKVSGGQGQMVWEKEFADITSNVVPGSDNVTINGGKYLKLGKLRQLNMSIAFSNQVSTWGTILRGLDKPQGLVYVSAYADKGAHEIYTCLFSDYSILARYAIPAGSYNISVTYITD